MPPRAGGYRKRRRIDKQAPKHPDVIESYVPHGYERLPKWARYLYPSRNQAITLQWMALPLVALGLYVTAYLVEDLPSDPLQRYPWLEYVIDAAAFIAPIIRNFDDKSICPEFFNVFFLATSITASFVMLLFLSYVHRSYGNYLMFVISPLTRRKNIGLRKIFSLHPNDLDADKEFVPFTRKHAMISLAFLAIGLAATHMTFCLGATEKPPLPELQEFYAGVKVCDREASWRGWSMYESSVLGGGGAAYTFCLLRDWTCYLVLRFRDRFRSGCSGGRPRLGRRGQVR